MKKLFTMIMVVLLTLTAVVSVSAAQDSFVPSVDVKDGPKVVLQTDSNGNSVAAIIYDKNGHETGSVAQGGIIITPLSGMNSAPDKVKNALQSAFNQINATDDLGELSKEIADYIKDNNLDVEIKDLVVSQLFDIRLDDEYLELLEDGGSFTVQLNVDESFLFLLMLQGNEWAICKDYTVNGNIVTLTLTGPTQIALVKSNYSAPDDPGIQSPQTSDYTTGLFISLGVLFAVGAVLLVVVYTKSKRTKKEN
ncbi:MAG: hypothetical protein PUA85_01845 [Oscillospiraceae bacterium]|nr:hypothetical protein [Oscillospiraceae bacterium]